MIRRAPLLALALVTLLGGEHVGRAETPGLCHVVDVDFTLADDGASNVYRPQVVVWIEDALGNYIETLYITQQTGTYGLGNRPGRLDFKSGPKFPYGRRETVFPVWAHKHGVEFPRLDYQNYMPKPCTQAENDPACYRSGNQFKCDLVNHECEDTNDSDLSHPSDQSSLDFHFCRPYAKAEPGWQQAIDTGTCASSTRTDKGVFSTTVKSHYPPRSDLTHQAEDTLDTDLYEMLNPFDSVSQATPDVGSGAQVTWPIPGDLPPGHYIMHAEVSKEFDFNATYNATTFPPPDLYYYPDYGEPARGQPSVIYTVPFEIASVRTTAVSTSYEGYGDPDGIDGNVRPSDGTIETAAGTGAGRLQLVSDGIDMYRVRVVVRPEFDNIIPGPPQDARVTELDAQHARVSFVESGEDQTIGKVRGYEIKYRAAGEITAANFDAATPIAVVVKPENPDVEQSFAIDNLLPQTEYSVGIRAYDDCRNTGPLTVVNFTTAARPVGEVDACFIATAAYGSVLANEVSMLRRFRDSVLRHSVLGELAVESYYTFGPAAAGVIAESELLRETARSLLQPVVSWARIFEH